MKLTRRAFAGGMVTLATTAARADGAASVGAVLGQMAATGDGNVLLNSYIVEAGAEAGAFDLTQGNAAYVYDNALAGIFLLAAGERGQAERIGQALAFAQAHDRRFNDGRLRNGYAAGPVSAPMKLPGFWDTKAGQWDEDPYQLGSDAGPMAWAMLLWVKLGMNAPAQAAARFINARLRTRLGYEGGLYGFDNAQSLLAWQSTEQNTDLAVAFAALGRTEDAAHAAAFVAAMRGAQTFATGTGPDGVVNITVSADAGIWPYLAGLGSAAEALAAIKVLQYGAGIGFAEASDGIWLEGTAFAALALKKLGNVDLAGQFLATIRGNVSPEGYVYASVEPVLSTGLSVGPAVVKGAAELPFNYYRRPSLSATCWAGLAELGVNPLGL